MKPKAILIIVTILFAGFALSYFRAVTMAPQDGIPQELMGSVWPDPQPLPLFKLTDHRGNPFGVEQMHGRWTMVFFGYTSCPDICPTTMMTLAGLVAELDKKKIEAPQVVLVSVDPERDDQEALARYVSHFHKDFVGVTGDEAHLYVLALNMGAMYSKEEADLKDGYEMAHSAAVFLVDPQGRKYGLFSPPLIPEFMADNLVQIQAYYDKNQ